MGPLIIGFHQLSQRKNLRKKNFQNPSRCHERDQILEPRFNSQGPLCLSSVSEYDPHTDRKHVICSR